MTAKSEAPCLNCGQGQKKRPMIFRGLSYCSDDCRKRLAERLTERLTEREGQT